jgi:hypothetical protein
MSCRKEYKQFKKALKRGIRQAQEDLLLSILYRNKNTVYGRQYGFSGISSIKQYQESVPLTIMEDYSTYINEMSAGKQNVLTKQKVILFELSSGSTSSSKLIPYTKGLKKDFHKGVYPWLYDMYAKRPALWHGKAYWSLSPQVNEVKFTKGGIRVGFEKDNDYFGFFPKFIFDLLMAIPDDLRLIQNIDAFRYVCLLFLLKERDLSFISIWNPTFLSLLLDTLIDNWDNLLHDLAHGTICLDSVRPELKRQLEKKLGKNIDRAKELKEIYYVYQREKGRTEEHGPSLFEMIWKDMSLVSCWTDSHSALFKEEIREHFPHVEIQGKGLLATEGIVSFPITGLEAPILSFRSHFMEFKSIDTGEIKIADELDHDKEYSVIITTNGGLYRYQLADIVLVRGFHKACPLVSFVGKEEKVSDYFGEKLNEYHVNKVLNDVYDELNIKPVFYMVAPEIDTDMNHFYVLFLELDELGLDKYTLSCIEKSLEEKLEKNFHYEYCIRLNQLQPIRIFIIDGGGKEAYINRCRMLGQKVGDIKPVILHTKTGWDDVFDGSYIS